MRTSDHAWDDGDGTSPVRREVRVELDERGRVVDWPAQAEAAFGFRAAEVLGRPASLLLAARPQAGPAPPGRTMVCHRDGYAIVCTVRISPAVDSEHAGRWMLTLTWEPEGEEPAVERAVLDALFTRSPVGLCVFDTELRVRRFNTAAQGLQGFTRLGTVGRRLSDTWPASNSGELEDALRQVLWTGEPVIGFEKHGRPPGDPEREHYYETSAFRLEDAQGRVLGLADTTVDVTEKHRARQRLVLLAEAGKRIGTSLDVTRTAQELAEAVVPQFADAAVVDLLETVLCGEEPEPGLPLENAPLYRAGYRAGEGVDHAPVNGDLPALPGRYLKAAGPRQASVREPGADRPPGPDQPSQDDILLVVPLRTRDVTLGLAGFYRFGASQPPSFQDDDILLAQDLGTRAAVALDNARRYTREHAAGLALRASVLHGRLPTQTAVDVARAVEAGRGWVDVISLSSSRVALVAGLVPGRGLAATAAIGRLRAAVRTLAYLDLAPDETLARLDEQVGRLAAEGQEPPVDGGPFKPTVRGATCMYALYDPLSRRCTVSTAGHPAPLITLPDGTDTAPELPPDAPLGMDGPPVRQTDLVLPEGSLITLHTGLAPDGRPAQPAELRRLLSENVRLPVKEVMRALTDTLAPRDRADTALLVARTHALKEDHVATWDLPASPEVVSRARALVKRQLAAWHLDELSFTTQLIVSELVTNAIRHAQGPVQVRLIKDRSLVCEVSDATSAAPRLRHPRTTDEGGRGLSLIAGFSERWGTRYGSRGKTIWTEQAIS